MRPRQVKHSIGWLCRLRIIQVMHAMSHQYACHRMLCPMLSPHSQVLCMHHQAHDVYLRALKEGWVYRWARKVFPRIPAAMNGPRCSLAAQLQPGNIAVRGGCRVLVRANRRNRCCLHPSHPRVVWLHVQLLCHSSCSAL